MGKTLTILVVEDNPDDVALTRRAFRKAGVEATLQVVEDGVEAVDYLMGTGRWSGAQARPLPTVVLLDLKLPRMDGHEVLTCIRAHARTRRLPVVMLTTSSEDTDLARSYDAGVNSYLRKPAHFEGFVEAARQLSAYWLSLNLGPPALSEAP